MHICRKLKNDKNNLGHGSGGKESTFAVQETSKHVNSHKDK